jgi:hypothetical protein
MERLPDRLLKQGWLRASIAHTGTLYRTQSRDSFRAEPCLRGNRHNRGLTRAGAGSKCGDFLSVEAARRTRSAAAPPFTRREDFTCCLMPLKTALASACATIEGFGRSLADHTAPVDGHTICSFGVWPVWPSTTSEACPATANFGSASWPLANPSDSSTPADAEKRPPNHRAAVHAVSAERTRAASEHTPTHAPSACSGALDRPGICRSRLAVRRSAPRSNFSFSFRRPRPWNRFASAAASPTPVGRQRPA